ncbi:hypothetical protein GCM10009634_66230 [Saccharothrix xinjiangensis]
MLRRRADRSAGVAVENGVGHGSLLVPRGEAARRTGPRANVPDGAGRFKRSGGIHAKRSLLITRTCAHNPEFSGQVTLRSARDPGCSTARGVFLGETAGRDSPVDPER